MARVSQTVFDCRDLEANAHRVHLFHRDRWLGLRHRFPEFDMAKNRARSCTIVSRDMKHSDKFRAFLPPLGFPSDWNTTPIHQCPSDQCPSDLQHKYHWPSITRYRKQQITWTAEAIWHSSWNTVSGYFLFSFASIQLIPIGIRCKLVQLQMIIRINQHSF